MDQQKKLDEYYDGADSLECPAEPDEPQIARRVVVDRERALRRLTAGKARLSLDKLLRKG